MNGREAARSSEWAQHFSNASCFNSNHSVICCNLYNNSSHIIEVNGDTIFSRTCCTYATHDASLSVCRSVCNVGGLRSYSVYYSTQHMIGRCFGYLRIEADPVIFCNHEFQLVERYGKCVSLLFSSNNLCVQWLAYCTISAFSELVVWSMLGLIVCKRSAYLQLYSNDKSMSSQ